MSLEESFTGCLSERWDVCIDLLYQRRLKDAIKEIKGKDLSDNRWKMKLNQKILACDTT